MKRHSDASILLGRLASMRAASRSMFQRILSSSKDSSATTADEVLGRAIQPERSRFQTTALAQVLPSDASWRCSWTWVRCSLHTWSGIEYASDQRFGLACLCCCSNICCKPANVSGFSTAFSPRSCHRSCFSMHKHRLLCPSLFLRAPETCARSIWRHL